MDAGSGGAFSSCSVSGTVITCTGDVTLKNNDTVTLASDVTATGTLTINKGALVNGTCTPFHPQCIGGGTAPLNHFSIMPATTSASTCLPNALSIIAEDSANLPVIDYTNQITVEAIVAPLIPPSPRANHGNWSINNADGILNPNPDTEDPIQIAGRPQAMTIAMWTDDGSGICGIDTNYNSATQSLEASIDRFSVLTTADDPEIGGISISKVPPPAASITLDFSATPGQASFNLDTTDVGQYELTVSDTTSNYSDSTITGTSVLLTVKPFGLAVTNIVAGATVNPGANTPGGDIFTTAGLDFSATVTAVLWDAGDDTDNDGVLDAGVYYDNFIAPSYAWDTTLLVSATGFEPATGMPGTLNNGVISAAEFGSGSVTITDLQYTEVGSFTLQSQALDFLGDAAADITGDDIIVGRFILAFFQITSTENGLLANACTIVINPSVTNPFTYIGETFVYDSVHPSFEISAMNALATPTVTQNYTGLLWAKLDDDSITFTQPTSDSTQVGSDGATLMSLSYTQDAAKFNITDNGNGTFNFEFANDQFVYLKDANSDISFFNSDINLIITDVTDLDSVTNSGTFTLSPSSIELRFGRIRMSNVYGSELNDLSMPMILEYLLSPSVYTINSDDFCSTVANGDLVIIDNLSVSGSSTVTVTNPTAIAGDIGVTLTKPGADIVGDINVSPDLILSVDKWLQWDWNGTGQFDVDPDATATFGIFSGNPIQIYIQQTYQ